MKLAAGTVDMIASFDGEPCVLDWKTSAKPKQPNGAILSNWRPTVPALIGCTVPHRDGVSFTECGGASLRYELKEYWRPWLSKLVAYWEQQFTPLAAQALMAIQEEYGHNRRLVKAD